MLSEQTTYIVRVNGFLDPCVKDGLHCKFQGMDAIEECRFEKIVLKADL